MLSTAKNEEQTEGQVYSSEGLPVMLGGKEYIIHKKRGRKHTKQFRMVLDPIADNIKGLGSIAQKAFSPGEHPLSSEDWNTITGLLSTISGKTLDDLLDLVYEWEPAVKADKEFLEGNTDLDGNLLPPEMEGQSGATDVEFLEALLIIIRFVYGPFVEKFRVLLNPETIQSAISGSPQDGKTPGPMQT